MPRQGQQVGGQWLNMYFRTLVPIRSDSVASCLRLRGLLTALLIVFSATLCTPLVAANLPTAQADGGAPNLVYVVGAGATANQLAVIDIGQKRVTSLIPIGGHPASVVLSTDGRFAYVTESAAHVVAIVDTSAHQVMAKIPLTGTPTAIVLDFAHTPNLLYIAETDQSSVAVVDPAAQRVVATISVGEQPMGMALALPGTGIMTANPQDADLYVTNTASRTISVISILKRQVISTIPIPGSPLGITIPQTGGVGYVSTNAGQILALNLAAQHVAGLVLQTLSVPEGGSPDGTGIVVGAMDYDAVTGQVYAPVPAANLVEVVAPVAVDTKGNVQRASSEPAQVLSISGAPTAVAITFEGSYGFVAQRATGMVTMLDATTHHIEATIPVGGVPTALVTGPYPPPYSKQVGVLVAVAFIALILVMMGITIFTNARYARRRKAMRQQALVSKERHAPMRSQGQSRSISAMYRKRSVLCFILLCGVVILALSGCNQGASQQNALDRYGGALNHVHDLLALRGVPETVLLATHIGLYRSQNRGRTWTEVAGGTGQPMDGLMIFKLAQSPLNPERIYVLAVPRPDNPGVARTPAGLYTSANAGVTWTLAAAAETFPVSTLFSIGTGASSPGEVFVVLPALGTQGGFVSDDAGTHWTRLPALPTTDPSGLLGMPVTTKITAAPSAQPQPQQKQQVSSAERLLLWSGASGLFESDNEGKSWHAAPGVTGGVYGVSQAGTFVYAIGDLGLYVSSDAGHQFTLIDAQTNFSAVVVCATTPQQAYGLTGTAVYVTTNSGQIWRPTAQTSQHPSILATDPTDPQVAYIGLSYPLGVAVTTNAGSSWQQVLP